MPNEQKELETTVQQRADYIPAEELLSETADSVHFSSAIKALTNKTLTLIAGPRGCGKTHMMRYAFLKCQKDAGKPFPVYVSFNRYARLEPLLSNRSSAIEQFHAWVLALLLLGACEASADAAPASLVDAKQMLSDLGFSHEQLTALVKRLERAMGLDEETGGTASRLSIEVAKAFIDQLAQAHRRKFSVLLLDDAAMTLAPEYLMEFIDVVRSMKSSTITPKASVYPGTTEIGPRFHAGQDYEKHNAWISVDGDDYDDLMQEIAVKRFPALDTVQSDVQAFLRFASFGIPRAYLSMLTEYKRGGFRTAQQGVNRIATEHLEARIAEYRSLSAKVPKFASIISAGEQVLNGMVTELKLASGEAAKKSEKQLTIGIDLDDLTALVERMFKLLMEAGLLLDAGEVKHGPHRQYKKFIPHAALILRQRALTSQDAGGSIQQTLQVLKLKKAKHPLRRQLSKLATPETLGSLNFDLPKCTKCGAPRLSDTQRFCHNCGNQLIDASVFAQCLDVPIASVPGLTKWQQQKIVEELPHFRTIRDYLAKEDPGAELRTIFGFGPKRTVRVLDVLKAFVDEFLS